MFLDLVLGTLFGFLLGLIPSLHINTLAYFFSLFGFFVFFKSHFYFFFALCIAQTLTSIIPSFLFNIPTTDAFISPFLGLKNYSKKSLIYAIKYSFLGFLFGGLFSILFLPIFYFLFLFFSDFYLLIFLVLLFVLFLFIFQERSLSFKLVVFSIIVFSGTLGLFTLKYNFLFKEPLIPCIFGLFAFPNILLILFSDSKKQEREEKEINKPLKLKEVSLSAILGTIFSSTVAIFPSLSPGLAMSFSFVFLNKKTEENKIIIYSSILSSVLLIYFFMSIVFNKHRIGYLALLSLNNIFPRFTFLDFFSLCFSFIFVLSFSVFLCLVSLKSIFNFINILDKKSLLFFISLFTILLIFYLSGISGLFLLLLATSIGFLPIVYNKNRLILMSYLIVPTILFFI